MASIAQLVLSSGSRRWVAPTLKRVARRVVLEFKKREEVEKLKAYKEEQKFTNNQLLEEVAINLQKIPFELQRKESLKTFWL